MMVPHFMKVYNCRQHDLVVSTEYEEFWNNKGEESAKLFAGYIYMGSMIRQ